jgi:hypothetical protein
MPCLRDLESPSAQSMLVMNTNFRGCLAHARIKPGEYSPALSFLPEDMVTAGESTNQGMS